MKNILVPTDFSECAEKALRTASSLARKTGAMIHLVHVYESPSRAITLQLEVDDNAAMNIRRSISDDMDAIIAKDFMAGVVVTKHYITEVTIWNLLELESMKDVELVVMGSHGASGFREFFIGSNTQKMLQTATKPVLVVKDDLDLDLIHDMAFVSNFYSEAPSSFAPIKAFAELLNLKVHLLKIITPANFEDTAYTERLMDDFAKLAGLSNYTNNTYNTMSVERGIHEFTDRNGIDLIAMETHGRTGLAHWLQGSTTEQVANHAKLPILSVKIEMPDYRYGVIFPK